MSVLIFGVGKVLFITFNKNFKLLVNFELNYRECLNIRCRPTFEKNNCWSYPTIVNVLRACVRFPLLFVAWALCGLGVSSPPFFLA